MEELDTSGNERPKISVLMSAYNSEKFISESIRSVLNQTYGDFELIITDDASTDGTLAAISEFTDSRLKVIKNRENRGLTANLNAMLEIAKGELIARIDADDICREDRFEEEARVLTQDASIYLVCSYIEKFGDEEGIPKVRTDYEFMRASIMFQNFIPHSTVMFRNDGKYRYNVDYNGNEDYELWERMIGEGHRIYMIPHALVKYRVHANQYTHAKDSKRDDLRLSICCRAFQRIGVELTDEEKRKYKKIVMDAEIDSFKDVYKLWHIYKKIRNANASSLKYSKRALYDALREQQILVFKSYLVNKFRH